MELVCERDKAVVDVYCIVIAFGSGNDDDTAVREKVPPVPSSFCSSTVITKSLKNASE